MQLDTLIINAHIITCSTTRPVASRIGIWQGLIIGVDEELDNLLFGPDAVQPGEVWDAAGACILAGFNDAHAHSVWFGQTLIEVDLANATTPDAIYDAIAGDLESYGPNEWVICSNFNPLQLTGEVDRDRLDEVAAGRPVLIKHRSGHAYTVNGVAMRQSTLR